MDRSATEPMLPTGEALVRLAIDSLPHASLSVFDSDLRCVMVRGQALASHGFAATLEGRRLADVLAPERAGFFEQMYRAALMGQTQSVEVHSPDGTATHLIEIAPLRTGSGEIVGGVSIATDITEPLRHAEQVRQLNEDLTRTAADLAVSNKELEAFAYSVAHDLRGPLRGVAGFSAALLQDYATALDERGRHFLDRLQGAVLRMGRLIDDLLRLSQASRVELHVEPVDLTALAGRIAAELREREPDRAVTFAIADGLRAPGDPALLGILLDNLLSNAWKYASTRPRARIEFGATEHDGETAFFVRDNGVGFDMAYADQLFVAFQRLHEANAFPGTGIGLAIAHRIVIRHGGRIWAESKPGRGATFSFSLALDGTTS